jgi:hypothetical protein
MITMARNSLTLRGLASMSRLRGIAKKARRLEGSIRDDAVASSFETASFAVFLRVRVE